MKIVLGCLMCLTLPLSEGLAISGGPVYPGATDVVGTYAGVIKPGCMACEGGKQKIVKCKNFADYLAAHPDASACSDDPAGCSQNSLGVFSISVPKGGISTGTFVMFSQGRVFNGTINGTADPGRAKLKGVLSATFNFTLNTESRDSDGNPVILSEQVTAMANGNLNTNIADVSSDAALGASATRLSGTATLDISQGFVNGDLSPLVSCEMALRVNGFKQSTSASTSTGTTGQ